MRVLLTAQPTCATPARSATGPGRPSLTAELFLYPGDRHLFADSSLPSYDEQATALLTERVLSFLDDIN